MSVPRVTLRRPLTVNFYKIRRGALCRRPVVMLFRSGQEARISPARIPCATNVFMYTNIQQSVYSPYSVLCYPQFMVRYINPRLLYSTRRANIHIRNSKTLDKYLFKNHLKCKIAPLLNFVDRLYKE